MKDRLEKLRIPCEYFVGEDDDARLEAMNFWVPRNSGTSPEEGTSVGSCAHSIRPALL